MEPRLNQHNKYVYYIQLTNVIHKRSKIRNLFLLQSVM